MNNVYVRWLLIAGILVSFGLSVQGLKTDAPTFDEQGFLVRGLGYLRGTNRHMRVGHPLGLNGWNALLLVNDETVALPESDPSWQEKSFHRPAELFLWEIGNSVEHIMFLARIQTVWLGLILAAVVFRWIVALTKKPLYGLVGGLFILFDPNLLAHGRLTTTDMGITAFGLISAYLMWRAWRKPLFWPIVWAGFGFALLNNTKFTAGLFVIFFALVILIAGWLENRGNRPIQAFVRSHHRLIWLFPLSGFLFLWGMYGFQISTLPAELPMGSRLSGVTLPLARHIEQLLDIGNRSTRGSLAFLNGAYSRTGWTAYFPITLIVKTPFPTLLLIWSGGTAALWHLFRTRRFAPHLLWLLIPPIGFFGFSLLTSVNIGHRHILPIMPFLIIWGAAGLATLDDQRARTGGLFLAAWLSFISISIAPHHIAFFNWVGGGPDQGWRILVDSNIDWGQDLSRLAEWVEENRTDQPLYISYFGEARPTYYQIEGIGLDSVPPRLMLPWANPLIPSRPAPGRYAISVTNLQGVFFDDRTQFAWFKDQEPIAKAGYSIFIYDVAPFGEPFGVALGGGLQPREIPEAVLGRWDTNQIGPRWFGGDSGWLLPAEAAFVAVPDAKTAELPSCFSAEPMPDWPGQVELDGADCRAGLTPVVGWTQLEGRLQLGRVTIEQAENRLMIETALTNLGETRPVKLFIHVENDNQEIVAQWDGFDVVPHGWQEGDLILHRHPISLPEGAGNELSVYIGLYDPETGARWVTPDGRDRVLIDFLDETGMARELTSINRWLCLAALLVGAGLRLFNLGELPNGLYHDEAYNGLDALALIEGETFPIFHEGWELYSIEAHGDRGPLETDFPLFFEGNYGREPLHIYLMAATISMFGHTPFAVRLVPALAGILGIWTTYLAASALFATRKASLIPGVAAFSIAVLFPAVHFSRFGLRVMLFLPVSTLTVAFFWWAVHALKDENRVRWALWTAAGLMLGLGIYVYAAGRIFPLLFIGFVPILLRFDRQQWRRWLLPIGWMAGLSILTAAPILIYYWRYPYYFFFRIAYVANRGVGTVEGRPGATWLRNIPIVLRGLIWQGETHFRHNLPGRPVMDVGQIGLFLIGWWGLTKPKERLVFWFVGLWFAVGLLPSVMSGDAPHFGRMSGVYPVVAILIGLGVDQISAWFGETRPASTAAGLVFVGLLSIGLTTDAYFNRYAGHPDMVSDFDDDLHSLGEALYAEAHSAPIDLFLAPTKENIAPILFALGRSRHDLRNLNLDPSVTPAGREGLAAIYAVNQNDLKMVETLDRIVSNGSGTLRDPVSHYQIALLPRDVGDPTGSIAQFGDQIELVSVEHAPDTDRLVVTLFWKATREPDRDWTAFVHLLSPEGEIIAQIDRQPPGYPTGSWIAGDRVEATFALRWPEGQAPAAWSIRTGFYDATTLESLGTPLEIEP